MRSKERSKRKLPGTRIQPIVSSILEILAQLCIGCNEERLSKELGWLKVLF
jgi:hypothetical protein